MNECKQLFADECDGTPERAIEVHVAVKVARVVFALQNHAAARLGFAKVAPHHPARLFEAVDGGAQALQRVVVPLTAIQRLLDLNCALERCAAQVAHSRESVRDV